MTLVLHDYTVIIAKQTPVADESLKSSDTGFTYEKAQIELAEMTEDEIHKIYGEAKLIVELISNDIQRRNWKT